VSAFAGAAAAYVSNPPAKPYPGRPALSFSWDGAATPTLTVTETADGTTCMTFSGQSLARSSGAPQSVIAAASPGGNPWEVGPA
jgi:hypothetical protein